LDGQPVVSVRGEAVLKVEPEIALVAVAVRARDADRRRALQHLDERRHAVQAVLDSHVNAIEKVEGGAVQVHADFKGGRPKERVAGYLTSCSFRIAVHDFTVLTDLASRLIDQEFATVAGPWWSLRPTSSTYRQARLAAAEDATRRARDYAEAFGGKLVALLEVADLGLLTEAMAGNSPPTSGSMNDMPMAAGRRAGGGGSTPEEPVEFDFTPEPQSVHAQIEARFTMSAPTYS